MHVVVGDITTLEVDAIGAYGFPKERASAIAHASVADWLRQHALPREVSFCCFGREDGALYETLLARAAGVGTVSRAATESEDQIRKARTAATAAP